MNPPNRKFKVYLNNILSLVNTLGTVAMLIIILHMAQRINTLIENAHSQTASSVAEIQRSEREQLQVLRCQFVLFGQNRSAVVTVQQLDACLTGTSLEVPAPTQPESQTPSVPTGNGSSVASRPVAVTNSKQTTDQPEATEPTTSAPPPDPDTPAAQSPSPSTGSPSPQPAQHVGILQPVVAPVLDIVRNVIQGINVF